MTDDLTRLAVASRQGDREALTAFVAETQGDVWRLCAYLVDPEAADDLVQETYLRAYRALSRFRAESSARTWLLSIARRACADEIRRRQRARRLPWSTLVADDVSDHAADVTTADLIARLSPERREAFVLTQTLGLSYAEAARVSGVPVGTIRSRVARARADLIEDLGEDQDRPAMG